MSKISCNNGDHLNLQFKSKEITPLKKDIPSITKTVYTHVSNIHRLLCDWVKFREKGVKLCKCISTLRLYEYTDDYYPSQLKPLVESLLEALDGLKNSVDGISAIDDQLKSLAKLPPTELPVICTWTGLQISEKVSIIHASLQNEYRLKQVITENIAHCRDEHLLEVYVSAWEFERYLNMESNSYLFVEVGLTGIT